MKIIINESQLRVLKEFYSMPDAFKDDAKEVDEDKTILEDYIENHGEYMYDITNGKTYMVQYLKALSELVGKDYAMCAPVRENGTYGAFYVKPYNVFKKKEMSFNNYNTPNVQRPRKPNLYQRLGLNKD